MPAGLHPTGLRLAEVLLDDATLPFEPLAPLVVELSPPLTISTIATPTASADAASEAMRRLFFTVKKLAAADARGKDQP